jgi:endonuclease/exonuclease/phosphatase (EEP) superfamily protein YafD
MLKFIRIIFQLINVVIVLGLLTIHFVIKEHNFWSSVYFYAFPLPVIIVVVLFLSVILTKKGRRYNLVIASILLVVWLIGSFKVHIPDTINKSDLEVVFWNVARDNTFETAIKESGDVPDIMVLVELENNNIEEFQEKYPNYYFYKSEKQIFIFSKSPIVIESETTSKHGTSVINFKTKGINFYVVDAQGSLEVPRAWGLKFINEQIKKTENTIILGDFNTPFESVFLKQIKRNFNHAFSKKGNGFKETWFYNLPLLSLDYIWVSKDLKILKTQKLFTTESDHSMLKTYIKH